MTNKSIQAVNRHFYPVIAGGEINTLETYSTLAADGWNIYMHATRDSLSEKNVFSKERERIRGIEVIRYRSYGDAYFPRLDFRDSGVIRIHTFILVPSFIILVQCFFLKLLGRKKFTLVLTPHSSFTPDWSIFPKWQVVIKRPVHYIAVFFINRTVDGIVAVSEWEKEQMVQKGIKPNLIRVIYNGIEKEGYEDIEAKASEKIKRLVRELGQYIIQVARIHPLKNQEVIIKTLPLLPANIKLAVVGPFDDSGYFRKLKSLTKELEFQDRVIFLGTITGHDKYYLMKHAQMMVHMASLEALGNAVHEGMGQGCVCIVSKNTGLEELIEDGVNGYHADLYDHRDVAEKINFVLENQQNTNIQSIKQNNIKVTRNRSWENTAHQLEEYFLQLLKQNQT